MKNKLNPDKHVILRCATPSGENVEYWIERKSGKIYPTLRGWVVELRGFAEDIIQKTMLNPDGTYQPALHLAPHDHEAFTEEFLEPEKIHLARIEDGKYLITKDPFAVKTGSALSFRETLDVLADYNTPSREFAALEKLDGLERSVNNTLAELQMIMPSSQGDHVQNHQ